MKRLISMDIIRGFALMLMVVFHVFLNVSDLVPKASNLASLSILELILVAFVALFIHWQSLFLMVSAIVHWFSMSKMIEQGISPRKILIRQLVFGGSLYIFGFLREPFLSPWGIIAQWFGAGGLVTNTPIPWHLWGFIYRAETLSNIGMSIMLTSCIFALVSSQTVQKVANQRQTVIKIGLLGILAILFIFLSPAIQLWVDTISGVNLQVGEAYMHDGFRNWFDYSNRWLLNTLAGRELPLFPNYSYFLVGSMIGVLLSQPTPSRKILLWGFICGIILTGAGAAYWLFVDQFLVTFDVGFHIHPVGFVIFSIGLQTILIMSFLAANEFNPRLLNERRLHRRLRNSRPFRRWGIMALTIFTFNMFEIVPRAIFDRILPNLGFRNGNLTLPWTLLLIATLLVMWEGIIRLWELAKFKGTMEWFFLRLFKMGHHYNQADPLDIKGTLYNVEAILFTHGPENENRPDESEV